VWLSELKPNKPNHLQLNYNGSNTYSKLSTGKLESVKQFAIHSWNITCSCIYVYCHQIQSFIVEKPDRQLTKFDTFYVQNFTDIVMKIG